MKILWFSIFFLTTVIHAATTSQPVEGIVVESDDRVRAQLIQAGCLDGYRASCAIIAYRNAVRGEAASTQEHQALFEHYVARGAQVSSGRVIDLLATNAVRKITIETRMDDRHIRASFDIRGERDENGSFHALCPHVEFSTTGAAKAVCTIHGSHESFVAMLPQEDYGAVLFSSGVAVGAAHVDAQDRPVIKNLMERARAAEVCIAEAKARVARTDIQMRDLQETIKDFDRVSTLFKKTVAAYKDRAVAAEDRAAKEAEVSARETRAFTRLAHTLVATEARVAIAQEDARRMRWIAGVCAAGLAGTWLTYLWKKN